MRHNDILTVSIGTPEHGGKVRGRSGWVGIKGAFGTGRKMNVHANCHNLTEVGRLIEEAVQGALKAQAEEFQQLIATQLQQVHVIPHQESPQVSSNVGAPNLAVDMPPVVAYKVLFFFSMLLFTALEINIYYLLQKYSAETE